MELINSTQILMLIALQNEPKSFSQMNNGLEKTIKDLNIPKADSNFVEIQILKKAGFVAEEKNIHNANLYSITEEGKKVLNQHIYDFLSMSKELDPRFKIGIYGIDVIGIDSALRAIDLRKTLLMKRFNVLNEQLKETKVNKTDKLAFFKYPLTVIGHEIKAINELLNTLKEV